MPEIPTFETFCSDQQLIGESISKAWETFYAAMDGLALDEEGIELYRAATGRDQYEPRVHAESLGICGRRSEKSTTALKFLLWKAMFAGWEKQLRSSWFAKLARHTRLLRIPIICQDMRVARDLARTLEALVMNSPTLSKEVAEVSVREIIFRNGIATTILPATKASTRGLTCPGGFVDELAWVQIEGASDVELLRQIRPSMIQFGQSRRLVKMTTPWLKSGMTYSEFTERASRPDLLVWQASTAMMTPRIALEDLERERLSDPAYFRREYEAQFTDDLEAFLPGNDIDAAIGKWKELPPNGESSYIMALDASMMTGGDVFTYGWGHSGPSGFVVGGLRGHRRASVGTVCDEIASVCQDHGIRNITADQFSFQFLAELMRQRGIGLEQLAFSTRSKPEVFFDLKNALATGKFSIPNDPDAVKELRALESTRTSGGNYKICAPRGQHDDYACVLALLAHKAKRSVSREPQCTFVSVADRPLVVDLGTAAQLGPHDFGPESLWHKL